MQASHETRQTGYILLTFKVHEEDGHYVSECDEFEVSSCGETIEEAFDALEDAVILYLTTLEEEGERERVFTERKIDVISGDPPHDAPEIEVRARLNEYVSPHPMRIPAVMS